MRQGPKNGAFFIAKIGKNRPSYSNGFEGQIGPNGPKNCFRCQYTREGLLSRIGPYRPKLEPS